MAKMMKAGDIPLGGICFIELNGVKREFFVVSKNHYVDNSVTLMLRTPIFSGIFGSSQIYENSTLDNTCNNTFYNQIDQRVRTAIIEVEIPSNDTTLRRKVFPPSVTEMGKWTSVNYVKVEGTTFQYFASTPQASSITDSARGWNGDKNTYEYSWLRSRYTGTQSQDASYSWNCDCAGKFVQRQYASDDGIRPVFNLPANFELDIKKTLGECALGEIVKFKIDGEYRNHLVVSKDHYGSGQTTLLLKEPFTFSIFNSSNSVYENSTLDRYCRTTYYSLIEDSIKNSIIEVGIQNYTTSTTKTLQRKVFVPSRTEMSKETRTYVFPEGTTFQYFAESPKAELAEDPIRGWYRPVNQGNYAWLRSMYTYKNYTDRVWLCYHSGSLGSSGLEISYETGVRPAINLPNNTSVMANGSLVGNRPPTISSDLPSGSNIGTQNTSVSFNYTVDDENGDEVTVSELVDSKAPFNTFEATLGEENTYTLDGVEFLQVLNGEHHAVVTADDGNGGVSEYYLVFNKDVDQATVTLKEPFFLDTGVSVAVLSIQGEFPEGTIMKVEATNNNTDWIDCTNEVLNEKNIVFTTTGNYFNFKIDCKRGTENGFIRSISGAYE